MTEVPRAGRTPGDAAAAAFARSVSAALRAATPLPVADDLVRGCLDPAQRPADALFLRAWQGSLTALPAALRTGRLGGLTGHVGESVVALLLDALGYRVLWQFVGPFSGGHGVDLLALSPDGRVVAVEVKATLRPGRWPRPSRGELGQLTGAWLGKPDNPGMANWDLSGDDVFGMVAVVNFPARRWRAALTDDFRHAHPVTDPADLLGPGRLRPPRGGPS